MLINFVLFFFSPIFAMCDTWNLSKNTYNAIGVYTYLTLWTKSFIAA